MFTKIVESTAANGLSNAPSRKLFKLKCGQDAGRMIAVVQTSASEIAFSYADPPYSDWYAATVIVVDAGNVSFDAVMDEDGNVYLVYCEQSTYWLATKKLSFSGGSWTVGNKVYIYNAGVCLAPSVSIESGGRLWVSWAQLSAGYYDVRVKNSSDNGLTWGGGSGDAGEVLRTGLSEGHSRIVITPGEVYVIYSGTGTDILTRWRPLSGGDWSAEFIIATGSNIDSAFDAAVSEDGLLGVVFDAEQLRYREFDGSNWSAVVTLDQAEAEYPQVWFEGNVPVVTYLTTTGFGRTMTKITHRRTGAFSTPELLDKRTGAFESVILYHAGSSSYADLTAAAASDDTADLFHPHSDCLVTAVGDAVYFGQSQPFRFLTLLLSTPGVGGTVAYSYFDGSNWKGFMPLSGNYNLESTDKSVVLWEDFFSIPQDWQKRPVNGIDNFWVKIEVVSSFSTGPVGTSLTGFSLVPAISGRR